MSNDKFDNGIIDVRVDDRMIHGIVATEWIPGAKATRAMVINKAASSSDMLRSTLKMATPVGVALSVLDPDKAITNINNGNYVGQRVFIIARHISDIYKTYKGGVKFNRINLGNVTQNQGDGITVLDKTVRVSIEEKEMLNEMLDNGINITCQLRRNDSEKDIRSLLK